MFGNKLATAQASITALLGAITSIGFKADTPEAVTAAGLQSHLAARENAAAAEAAAPLQEQLAVYTSGLAAAGITVSGEQLTAEGIKQAIETKIAATAQTKAVETIASSGHAAALAVPPGQDVAPSAETMTRAELAAAIGAEQDVVKRKRLFDVFDRRFGSGRN